MQPSHSQAYRKKKQINKISSKNKIAFTQLDSEFKNILIQEFVDSANH